MAVSDIPPGKITNVRSSFDELLYYIPITDRYRWDADHSYMKAMGYKAVDGQVPLVPTPLFSLAQVGYLSDAFVSRSQLDLKYTLPATGVPYDNLSARLRQAVDRAEDTWNRFAPSAQVIAGQDLNDLVVSGQYRGHTLKNAPNPNVGSWYYVEVVDHDPNFVMQRVTGLNSETTHLGSMFTRVRENGIWTAWKRPMLLQVGQTGVDFENLGGAVQTAMAQAGDNYRRFGPNAFNLSANTSLNDLHESGQYRGNSLLNTPGDQSAEWFYIEVVAHGREFSMQRATQFTGSGRNREWTRLNYAGAWEDWYRSDATFINQRFSSAAKQLGPGSSLDTLYETGVYRGESLDSAPQGMKTWFFIEVMGFGDSIWTHQRATAFTGVQTYQVWERQQIGNGWGPWYRTDSAAQEKIQNPTDILMMRWLSALRLVSRGSSNAKLVFVGDSTTAGVGAPIEAESFVAQLSNRLAMDATVQDGAVILGSGPNDPRLERGSYQAAFGPGSGALYGTQNSGAPAIFRPAGAVDTIEIWWYKSVGKGTVTVNIDGVNQPTIDTGSTDGSYGWRSTKYSVPLAEGHVVTIPSPNVNPVHLFCESYNSTLKSIRVSNWGVSGSTLTQWNDTPYSLDAITDYNPDLTVIMLGINDAFAEVTEADYRERLRILIVAAKRNGGDVIVMSPIASDGGSMPAIVTRERVYQSAGREVAHQQGAAFIDIFSELGPFDGQLFVDGLHPNSRGYSRIARIIIKALRNL